MMTFEFEVETEPVFEYEYLVDDVTMLAKYYIDLYFCDKIEPHGSISKKTLHSKRYIDYVLNKDIRSGMDQIYNSLGVDYTKEQLHGFEKRGQIPDDVKYVISTLRDMSRRGIPKEFAIGIFLMNLELCDQHQVAA